MNISRIPELAHYRLLALGLEWRGARGRRLHLKYSALQFGSSKRIILLLVNFVFNIYRYSSSSGYKDGF